MNYNSLIDNIQVTHDVLQTSVSKAINTGTTIRNWLLGYYIVEFEQKGEYRAKYGDKLLSNISKSANIKGLSVTNLKLFRPFYKVYPEIAQAVIDYFEKNNLIKLAPGQLSIGQSLSDELQYIVTKAIGVGKTNRLGLIPNLSFSHIVELPSKEELENYFKEK